MEKELYQHMENRDIRFQELKKKKARLIVKRRTGPQNIDPFYVKDADHNLDGEYKTYFSQLYAVEWEK